MNLFLVLSSVFGYRLLPDIVPTYPKAFQLCDDADHRLVSTFYKTANQIINNGYAIVLGGKSASALCNSSISYFGTTYVNNSTFTSTVISNQLLGYPNAMYNTLLHELLHAIGLDHNRPEPGMMSYSLVIDETGKIIEDANTLWPSLDDCRGLAILKAIARRVL